MVVSTGSINNIKITAIASDFNYMGASVELAEGEAFLYAAQYAIEIVKLYGCYSRRGHENAKGLISLSQMTRTTLAINELKKVFHI